MVTKKVAALQNKARVRC